MRLIGEYLDHPVSQDLVDDLARQQRSRPASEQIADLEALIASTMDTRDDLLPAFTSDKPSEVLAKLGELLAAMNATIDGARRRISELGSETDSD